MTADESTVPPTYAEFAATTGDVEANPSFTEWLRERAEPAWTDAVEHSFTRNLGAGTLSEDAYAEYLVQDYAFITDLVATFGYAVGQAPDMAAKRPLVEFLETLTDDENDYFERSFDALEVPQSRRHDPELAEPTAALVDLLARGAHEGGYAETLAVVVPAEWIYEQWAVAAVEAHGDPTADGPPSAGTGLPFYFAEWIDLHATEGFRAFVDWLRGQLDSIGPELSSRRQARVDSLFRRTVTLEVAFFEMASDVATREET